MRKRLIDIYSDLKESASASDFPNLLGNTMYKKLLARFNGFPSNWKMWTLQSDLADFKPHDRIILSEAPDPRKIEADGEYHDIAFTDDKYSLQAETWGFTFTVGRQAIINDDLNGISRFPDMMGRAMVRKMVKNFLTLLNGGSNAYDGNALFALRGGSAVNYIVDTALANTAAGMLAVQQCVTKVNTAKDRTSNELLGAKAKYLLTGSTLFPVAQQLIKSTNILPVSTNGGGTYNTISNLVPIEEPLIDDILGSAWWAVLADPLDCPVVEAGFLNGKETPDMLAKKPEAYTIMGGADDQFGYEFDELSYKVRHDFGAKLAYYQGICRGHS